MVGGGCRDGLSEGGSSSERGVALWRKHRPNLYSPMIKIKVNLHFGWKQRAIYGRKGHVLHGRR